MYGKLIFEDLSTLKCNLKLNVTMNYQNEIDIKITLPYGAKQQLSRHFPRNNNSIYTSYKQNVRFTDGKNCILFYGLFLREINVYNCTYSYDLIAEAVCDHYEQYIDEMYLKNELRKKKLKRIVSE